MMQEKIIYAQQWNVSAKFFYEHGYYNRMCDAISEKQVVLEVGCGTGYSTLSLLECGHKVIALDKNQSCIDASKQLLIQRNYIITEDINEINKADVCFIKSDIILDSFYMDILPKLLFDIVICWNVGSYWNKNTISFYYRYMLNYGLTPYQIQDNPESSYSELVLWNSCKIAKLSNVPVHIVDRGSEDINSQNDEYYCTLKTEFGFENIIYNNLKAVSISEGGRVLVTNGTLNMEKTVDIMLVSIFIE